MAKKKTHNKSGHRKRRRVGAMKGSIEQHVITAVAILAGGVAAAYLVQAAETAMGASTDKKIPTGIVAALGAAAIIFGKDNAALEGAGAGVLAVSGVMFANETFLNVPGISGPGGAFSSRALPQTPVMRQAVGGAVYQTNHQNGVGAGPKAYLNQTIGATNKKMMRLGMLASN